MREQYDTVIIGGGQSGLAMSYHLSQRGREHIVLERHRVAERWRTERWDSLRFQLPNSWLELPGKRYEGTKPDAFSHYTDVIRFVVDYADEIGAPVRTGVEVTSLAREDGGHYRLETSGRPISARHVIIATGPFQRALVPDCAGAMPASVHQIDAAGYRNPERLPPGAVLVVGSGNSGCQIADELLRSGRRVFQAISRHVRVPRRYRGKDVIWWYEHLGRFDVDINTFPGRRYPPTTLMTGIDGGYDIAPRHLADAGVTLLGRLLGVENGVLSFDDDADEILAAADQGHAAFIHAAEALAATLPELQPDEARPAASAPRLDDIRSLDLHRENIGTIIWACGHRYGFDWVNLPIIDANGVPIQQRGVTPCPGVYFLGLHWMHTFRSAILPFVGRDAGYLADQLDRLPQA